MIHALSPGLRLDAPVIGGKAHGLVTLMRLGLPVPPGFVLPTTFGRPAPDSPAGASPLPVDGLAGAAPLPVDGLAGAAPLPVDGLAGAAPLPVDGLAEAVRELETACGRRFGDPARPLFVSVRSGAAVSMPGMMDTVLNVGSADALDAAVRQVFASWNTPRAITYRELHGIPHDTGTAVVVQAMVFGDRDDRSGSGVAFSRDPSTGERQPYGDVLYRRQGDAVVSGTVPTLPLDTLATRSPAVWAELLDALDRVERHYRDVCHVEFTVESGRLWLLQVRPGGLSGRAAVRVAVDLVDERLIDRATALRRITPAHLAAATVPRIRATAGLTRGLGASPGVATGRVAVTADSAVRMASGGPVVLVRPHTSPLDMHGLAAAAGILTTTGGLTSHAAVVARSMGKPAVVAATALSVGAGHLVADGRTFPEGTLITIDGSGGDVVLGAAETVAGDGDPHLSRLLSWTS
ncbi:PEP/pyruvate-binding domain-containing protein [Actinoplanes sp. NPDC049802]|uniref:PEP/pyruvate-binding domain-containing protein n=1 Tax=Actinoplanes sp. NPDC049802 TaxID=3154742 RepID=UPI0033D04AFA